MHIILIIFIIYFNYFYYFIISLEFIDNFRTQLYFSWFLCVLFVKFVGDID